LLRKILFGLIIIWIIDLCPYKSIASNYYWVGGTGNWSDINHWVTTSGGSTNYLQVPTPFDDVFFDANSFNATNHVVTIDAVNSVCRDMNWTGSQFNPAFTGGFEFRIYGSLILIPDMNWNYSGEIYFEATSLGKTITSSGKTLTNVIFQGIGGGWSLTDALTVSYWLFFNSGSLNTNSQSISCAGFYSSTTDDRTLILGSSVITIIPPLANPGLTINSTNFTLDAGTSVLKIFYNADTLLLSGNRPLAFYNLELINTSSSCTDISVLGADYFDIRVKTSIHKLTLSGKYIQVLNNGSTDAVNVKIDSLVVADTCEKSISDKNNLSINTILSGPGTNCIIHADQNDTIQNIFFNGTCGTINGNDAKFHKVIYSGNGIINGNNSFDTLSFAAGKEYYLSSGNTQTINNFFSAEGNCSKSILLHSSSNGTQCYIQKTTGTVSTNYLILRDINAIGGATFISTNSIDMGGNTGWTITGPTPLNLFWVGNGGNWSDPTHWSLTSGGAGGACIPTPIDNVFFDANSFSTPGQIIVINDANAICNNMDWTNTSNSPALSGPSSNNLRIYGSLTLIPGMNCTFQGKIMFESTSTGKTIVSAGKSFTNDVYFQGVGGGWILMDPFESGILSLINGTLNTNNQPVNCVAFYSNNLNTRYLVLGSSIVTINSPWDISPFKIQSSNLTIYPGTSLFKIHYSADTCLIFGNQSVLFNNIELYNNSLNCVNYGFGPDFFDIRVNTSIHKLSLFGQDIRIVNSCSSPAVNVKIDSLIVNDQCNKSLENENNYSINTILCNPNTGFSLFADQNDTIKTVLFNGTSGSIYGSNAKFQKVIFSGDGFIWWSNTYDTLSFASGHTYYLTDTQTINNLFIADGTCSAWITFFSIPAGTQANIFKSSGNVAVNYVILKDMNAMGGATFLANNCVDLGNNTGWVINSPTPLNLYWVGGTGNWNETNHWSLTSGGTGGACVPTPYDNVFFDTNSFSSSNQIVTLTYGDSFCNDMDWTGVTNFPTFTGNGVELYIFGSLKFIPEMTVSTIGSILFEATSFGKTITSGGNSFHCSINFQGIGGGWTLNDALSTSAGIYFWSGTLNTNNQPVNCVQFYSGSYNQRSLILGSSVLTINALNNWTGFTFNSTNLMLDAGTSVIKCNYSIDSCIINGDQPLTFHEIELTNNYSTCTTISVLGADYFDIQAPVNINKLTLSGRCIEILNNGLGPPVNVTIDSLVVNDSCYKSLEAKNNYSINSITCNPNTSFRIFVDQNDTIKDVYFNGNQGTISGSGKFRKVNFSCDGLLEGSNNFDSLSFAPGKYYFLQSGSTQTINDHLNLRGNGCFPITLQSNISGLQSNISKNSGTVSADYVEMRDQNATGGAQFYAGGYSTDVSNNTGWIFSNAPNYSYGLGPDTSFCEGDTLLLTTINFNGGIAWLWQDGNTDSIYQVTQPGTYWVEVTYSNDCFYSDTIHITQRNKPLATASSNSPVCAGDTLKLFGSGGTLYSWTGPNGFTSDLQNPIIPETTSSNSGDYILITDSMNCSSLPDATSVSVVSNPNVSVSVSANPTGPVCQGTSVTFTAIPLNGGSLPSYNWEVNGANVGTNAPTYTYIPANGDIVTCVLTSNLSCATGNPATSNTITMTVNDNPPVSVSISASENPICSGTSVTFTATPTNGGSSPGYQWKVNGTNVGTNNPTFTYIPLNSDIITCILTSNTTCSTGSPATSNAITMTVNPLLPVSVSITASEDTVCSGTDVTFTATPVNEGTLPVYQWKVNGVNVGTNSANYSFVPSNNDAITCVLTSNANCATGNPASSNVITMTVNPSLPVSISISESENPICSGTSVTYTATPVNEGTLPVYQWKVNGVDVGTYSPTYTFTPSNNDLITCILTSNATCATGNPASSNVITMTVNPSLPVSVSISASENPVCSGTSVTYTATPVNEGTLPVYQWKVNGLNVGTNSANYSFVPSNNDAITCVLTSNASCATGNPATSNAITMTVNPLLPVSVSIAASENPVCNGTDVTFTATPTNGGSAPNYQWHANGTNVGTNNPTYSYTPSNNDVITCILTSNATCATGSPATSNTITMMVNPLLPVSVSITASEDTVCSGTDVTFIAYPTNEGSTPIYNWQVNGTNVGTNSPTYSYTPSNNDVITCILTSNATCATANPATSNVITMTFNPPLPVSVSISASGNPVCQGIATTFNAIPVNEGPNPTYQWRVNGNNTGLNSQIFIYVSANNDTVSCILTSNLDCVTNNPDTSNNIIMQVSQIPVITYFPCTDTVTTLHARPYTLKRCIPYNGTYSGTGVDSITGKFVPSMAGTGVHLIKYSVTNSTNCTSFTTFKINVLSPPSFSCGSYLTDVRDNHSYPTFLLPNGKCWMGSNLNYGNHVPGTLLQTDNCQVEKYCSGDSLANCNLFGGLYQWDELTQYEISDTAKGICPPEWHIPDSTEWAGLIDSFGTAGLAGDKLKEIPNSNGFQALLHGIFYQNDTWFLTGGPNKATMYWSSTEHGNTRSLARGLNESTQSVSLYYSPKNNALQVRCVKDD